MNKLNDSYQEIHKLAILLSASHIPHTVERFMDGWRLCYPSSDNMVCIGNMVCSVVQHHGSYGHEEDKLEIMGLLTPEEKENDSVKGWLTAIDVFWRIFDHYNAERGGGEE